MLVSEDLLKMFKKSIGDFNATTIMDDYYTNFLNMAIADLENDDIRNYYKIQYLGGLK